MKRIFLYVSAIFMLAAVSCKKDYLETKPSNGVTEQEIFSKLNTVYAALDGIVKEQFARPNNKEVQRGAIIQRIGASSTLVNVRTTRRIQ